MKKLVTLGIAVTLTLAISVTAFAAEPVGRINFVDTNEDGICDYIGSGIGRYFIDEDEDGVCDYVGTRQVRQNNRSNCGNGRNRN